MGPSPFPPTKAVMRITTFWPGLILPIRTTICGGENEIIPRDVSIRNGMRYSGNKVTTTMSSLGSVPWLTKTIRPCTMSPASA